MQTLQISELEQSLALLNLSVPLPAVESADALTKPLDLCRIYLAEILASLVEGSTEAAYKSIQWPNDIYSGDLTIVLPKLRPGVKSAELAELADDLMGRFPEEHPLFLLPIPDKVHFRMFLEVENFARLLIPFILDRKRTYGNVHPTGSNKSPDETHPKLVVEFSSPNITSEFQGKHLRSTIIGSFVSKMHELSGWDVTRINYLGDWGKPIALLKVGFDKFGNEEAFQADPVGHLLEVYHKIEEVFQPEMAESRRARDAAINGQNVQNEGRSQADIESSGTYAERNAVSKKLEEGDEETLKFWTSVRDANIENYKDFYSQLGINFDEYTGESQVKPETMMEVEQLLKEKEICKESEGAWVVHMQDYGLKAGTAIIRDRTGATTYLLRDLAAVIERSRKYGFDKMIIVAANDNGVHFTHVLHILKAIGMEDLAKKVQHLKFSEVSKMSEKLGQGYRPQAIITHCEEATATALDSDQQKAEIFGNPTESAKTLGIASLLAHELSARTASAHSFDTATMTASKPGSGLDLQYWYAKLGDVLKGRSVTSELSDDDYAAFTDEDAANLLRTLAQYPEVTSATYQSLEPAAIVTYLANITELLAQCLNTDEDDDEGEEYAPESDAVVVENEGEKSENIPTPGLIALYQATHVVLENGMRLLGLAPFEKKEQQRADSPISG